MSRLVPHPLEAGRIATGYIQSFACITALSRGLDYVTPTATVSRSLGLVEAAAPLWVWGLLLLCSITIVGAGVFGGKRELVMFGHMLTAGLYLSIGIGQLSVLLPTNGLDGFRTGVGLAVGAGGIHSVLACIAFIQMRDRKVDRAARAF